MKIYRYRLERIHHEGSFISVYISDEDVVRDVTLDEAIDIAHSLAERSSYISDDEEFRDETLAREKFEKLTSSAYVTRQRREKTEDGGYYDEYWEVKLYALCTVELLLDEDGDILDEVEVSEEYAPLYAPL